MDRICVVDASIPAYANPTARECYVMVGASAEPLEAMASAAQAAALINVAGVSIMSIVLVFAISRRGVRR